MQLHGCPSYAIVYDMLLPSRFMLGMYVGICMYMCVSIIYFIDEPKRVYMDIYYMLYITKFYA